MGVVLGAEVVAERAREVLDARRDRAIARDLEVGSIGFGATWVR